MVLEIIIITVALIYAILIIWLTAGWLRLPYFFYNSNNYSYNKISIIIPARNEADNICDCLEELFDQEYPKQYFEVIIVDDHSTDETYDLARKYIFNNNAENFRIISLSDLSNKEFGKKSAINAGIKAAKFDYILTTDADCQADKYWIETINNFILSHKPEMIVMPVVITRERTFFQYLQSLEFISTTGATGATAGWGKHIMGNGANLCFSKRGFVKVGGYTGNLQYASGDDIFLLHKMKKVFPGKIHYLKNKNAIVKTKALHGIKKFFSQKIRWASKSKAYKDPLTLLIAGIIGIFNLLLVLSIIFSLILGLNILLWPWIIKIVIDFPFLMMVSSFFKKKKLLFLYPLASVLYPFYVFVTILPAVNKGFSWKGRYYS